jgi:glutamate synthase domain-containing protein 1
MKMCGIMGYCDKTGTHERELGATMLRMLTALGQRGPDSAGVAMYAAREDGAFNVRIKLGEPDHSDGAVRRRFDERAVEILKRVGAQAVIVEQQRNDEYLHLVIGYEGDPKELQANIEGVDPEIEVISFGAALDIVKQVGSPAQLEQRFTISNTSGTHAIAHTRLSTESKIDLSHSQPFWAPGSLDIASVHNGHITNYHKLRRQYEQRGVRFYTENDSEIIGLYLAEQMEAGASFQEALQSSVDYFDGSFSYLAATENEMGFAKDPFGLKPLIVAETDEFVAIATEEVALRAAFGEDVETWEPPAGTVKTWQLKERGHAHS